MTINPRRSGLSSADKSIRTAGICLRSNMASMPWFRLYSEILDDKKIKRICRATSFNKVTIIGVWVCLLALAGESEDRGKLMISENIPYELNDLACETEMPEDDLDKLLNLFIKYDMLKSGDNGIEIANWDGRQFKSDDVSKRVAKHREKKRKEQESAKRYGNVIDTDTESDTEEDTDTEEIREKELLFSFCEETQIPLPVELTHPREYIKWIREVSKWLDMGVMKNDIKSAVDKSDKAGLTLAWPGSLTKILTSEITRNKRGVKPEQNTQVYIGPDGERIERQVGQ